MSTMSIDRGCFYVTNGSISGDTITYDTSTGTYVVKIDEQKVDDSLNNALIEFPLPKPSPDDAAQYYIIDIKRIKNQIAIQGVLATDSDSNALTKKQYLMAMSGYGGNGDHSLMSSMTATNSHVTCIWGQSATSSQQKVVGNIVKLMITETPGIISDGTTNTGIPMSYAVQLALLVGKDRRTQS